MMSETAILQPEAGDDRNAEIALFREIDAILKAVEPKVGFGEFVIDPDRFGYMSLGKRYHIGR